MSTGAGAGAGDAGGIRHYLLEQLDGRGQVVQRQEELAAQEVEDAATYGRDTDVLPREDPSVGGWVEGRGGMDRERGRGKDARAQERETHTVMMR